MKIVVAILFLSLIMITAPFERALSQFPSNFWRGSNSVSNEFSDPLNWVGGVVPEDPVFNSGSSTVSFGAGITVSSFSVARYFFVFPGGGGATAWPGNFTFGTGPVGSQTLTLRDGGDLGADALYATTQIFNAKIVLGESGGAGIYRFSGALMMNGPITGGSGGEQGDKMLVFESLAYHAMLGVISDGGSHSLGITASDYISPLVLGAQNTYTGKTIVNGRGGLLLGVANAISELSDIILQENAPLICNFDQKLGSLSLPAPVGGLPVFIDGDKVYLNFGGISGTDCNVSFADSREMKWDYKLSLLQFDIGLDTLRFGTSDTALTDEQLSLIYLPGYAADLDQNGYVTFTPISVPEPWTLSLLILGGLAVALCRFGIRSRKA